jgi:hypothetical protein
MHIFQFSRLLDVFDEMEILPFPNAKSRKLGSAFSPRRLVPPTRPAEASAEALSEGGSDFRFSWFTNGSRGIHSTDGTAPHSPACRAATLENRAFPAAFTIFSLSAS